MSKKLNKLLKKAYNKYQNDPNPPIPLKTIKEFLELEGISLEDTKRESLK
jgi:hypothetical protein